MSSSDDRRRRTPRVAGQRRRPRPVERAAGGAAPLPAGVAEEAHARNGVRSAPGEPAPGQEAGGADEAGSAAWPSRGGSRLPRALWAPLAALAVSLFLLAAVAVVTFADPDAADRDARAATAAARADLEQLLSYDHATLEQQAARNAELLTGPFRAEYTSTMTKTILPLATQEKAVVRARSYEAGVMARTADTVTVQVFLDQAKTSAGQEQPSVDQNRVIATMQRVGDRWLIARLVAY